jgi:hypothetical protein
MKIQIEIDCTPAEARSFLGLPDVSRMQEAMLADAQERFQQSLNEMDAESLARLWMPGGLEGMERLQKTFWGAMTRAAGKPDDST